MNRVLKYIFLFRLLNGLRLLRLRNLNDWSCDFERHLRKDHILSRQLVSSLLKFFFRDQVKDLFPGKSLLFINLKAIEDETFAEF